MNLSLNQALQLLLLYLKQIFEDSNDSSNFSERGYLSLILKDSVPHIHGLAIYVKEGLPFPWDLSLGNSENSGFTLFRALFPFPLSITILLLVSVFGDLNFHKKYWLTYSSGTARPG